MSDVVLEAPMPPLALGSEAGQPEPADVDRGTVAKHNKKDDLWIILDGKAYDMTSYLQEHPGGDALMRNAGGDASEGFHQINAHKYVKIFIKQILETRLIGRVQQ